MTIHPEKSLFVIVLYHLSKFGNAKNIFGTKQSHTPSKINYFYQYVPLYFQFAFSSLLLFGHSTQYNRRCFGNVLK
jgi:hypothetical protein